MKNIKNITLLSFLFLVGLMVTSCVQDDDYNIPEINVTEPNIQADLTIADVKEIYGGFEPKIIEAGDGSDKKVFIEGYVVSNDQSGNFYKTLVIQDSPENPTAGISISTNSTDLYTKYEPGRKIYFQVDGLYSGVYANLPTIGTQDGDQVGRISITDFESRIFRSTEKADLVPRVVSIPETMVVPEDGIYLNPYLNTLVKFEGVQFPDNLAGEHYGNVDDTFNVNRAVEDCDDNTIILRNSGFADFKNLLLPEGNGSLTAVFSIFNTDFQIFIRDTDDLDMTGERCSGSTGGGGTGDAMPIPFTENFETAAVGAVVNIPGWTNVNVNGGADKYEVRSFNNNQYAQTSAYKSGDDPYEVWLVTPGLILPSGSAPTLTFGTNDGYYNGDALTVKISTDFTGDVTTATWTNLNAALSSGHTDGYGDSFTPSGDIDLSAYAGQTVYIAYQYVGSDSGVTTTYQVDDVSVQ